MSHDAFLVPDQLGRREGLGPEPAALVMELIVANSGYSHVRAQEIVPVRLGTFAPRGV